MVYCYSGDSPLCPFADLLDNGAVVHFLSAIDMQAKQDPGNFDEVILLQNFAPLYLWLVEDAVLHGLVWDHYVDVSTL